MSEICKKKKKKKKVLHILWEYRRNISIRWKGKLIVWIKIKEKKVDFE